MVFLNDEPFAEWDKPASSPVVSDDPPDNYWNTAQLNWADTTEKWLAQHGGDVLIRANEGLNRVGENLAAWVTKSAGRGDIAAKIYTQQRQRDAWLGMIENGGFTEKALGKRGARVVRQTMQSLGEQGTVGYLTGGLGVYGYNTTQAFEQALDDGQRSGLEGGELLQYATSQGVLEGGIMFLMGRAGKKLGFDTLEESFSPVARNAVRSFLHAPSTREKLTILAKELGGMTAEGVEEALTNGGQQLNGIAFDQQSEFDWGQVLEAGAGGVLGRGALSAVGGLKSELRKFEQQLPDITSGIRAARVDIQRGVNPFEIRGIEDAAEFEKQTGLSGTSDVFRQHYKEALNFYVDEARREGRMTELKRWERESSKVAEEALQRRQRTEGRTGESQVALEQELPERTANDRAVMSREEFEKRTQVERPDVVHPVPPPDDLKQRLGWVGDEAVMMRETRLERSLRARNQQIVQHKQTIQQLRQSMVENKRLTKRQQDLAAEIVQQHVPPADRGKFIKRVLGATRPSSVNKFLNDVQKSVDLHEHRLARQGLKESFRKARNLRSEFAQQVQHIADSIDTRNFNHSEAARALREQYTKIPNTELTPGDQAVLELLSKRPIKDMTADEINDFSETVQRLTYQSEIADKLVGEQFAAGIQDTSEQLASEIAKAPKREMKSDSAVRKLLGASENAPNDRTFVSKAMHEAGERPEVTLDGLGKPVKNQIYEPLRKARNKASLDFGHILRDYSNVLDAVGLEHNTDSLWSTVQRRFGKPGNKYEAWLETRRTFNGADLRRDVVFDVMTSARDATLRRWLEKGGLRVESADGNIVEIGPITDSLWQQFEDFLGPEGLAMVDHTFSLLQSQQVIGVVNDSNQALTGRPLTQKQGIVPAPLGSEEDVVRLLSADRAGKKYLLDSYGHLKHRETTVSPLTVRTDNTGPDRFFRHAQRMNKIGHMMVPARNVEALLNNPVFKGAVISNTGEFGYNQIADAVRTEVVGYGSVADWERGLSKLSHTVAGAMVGAKLTIIAGQPFDTLNASAYEPGGVGFLVQALREYNERGARACAQEAEAFGKEFSGEWNHRFETGNYLGEVTQGIYGKTGGYFQSRSLVDHAADSLQWGEKVSAATLNYLFAKAKARAMYGLKVDDYGQYASDQGWSGLVADTLDKQIVRGSNSSHPLELSSMLRAARSRPLLGLALNFYGQAHKVYSLFPAAQNEFDRGNYRAAARYAAAGAASTLVWSAIQQAFSLAEKEKEQHDLLARYSHRIVKNLMGLNPAAGIIDATGITDAAMGYPMYQDNPVLLADTTMRLTSAGVSLIGQVLRGFDQVDDQEKFLKNLLDIGQIGGAMLGIPTYGPVDIGKRVVRGSLAPGLEPAPSKPAKMPHYSVGYNF